MRLTKFEQILVSLHIVVYLMLCSDRIGIAGNGCLIGVELTDGKVTIPDIASVTWVI